MGLFCRLRVQPIQNFPTRLGCATSKRGVGRGGGEHYCQVTSSFPGHAALFLEVTMMKTVKVTPLIYLTEY